MKNDRLIVTCITGNYEIPTDGFQKKDGYDYILVSDKDIKTKSWKNVVIEFNIEENLSNAKKSRYIKTHLWELFPNYKLITWIDAVFEPDIKLYNYIEQFKNNKITFKKHNQRDCIYDEINECIKLRKETKEIGDKLIERYQKENYPKHNGLFENNVFILQPNHDDVKKLFKLWWREIYLNSHRDQLSLNYIIWKYHLEDVVSMAVSKDFKPKVHKKKWKIRNSFY